MDATNDQLLQSLPPRPMTMTDRKWRGNICPAPNCPRCASYNTKFCYYNNYSLSQPRFFCKGCRRYWTKGGSLRNVPVGGGCRKSRRSRSARGFLNTKSGSHCDINSSPNSSSTGSELGCPDIDMAAVFAKFLNPGQENINEEINDATNTSSEASYGSPMSSSYGLDNGLEYQKLSDDFLDNLVPSDHKQHQVEEVDQGFMNHDLTSFDNVIDDDFWLNDSNLSGLMTWQPLAHMQEFNSSLPPAEEPKNSTNLFSSDNWSYFDSTEFEVFSGL